VLQVAGTKRWVVREPAVDAPLPRHPSEHEVAALQPVLFEAMLEPGDTLYLPRGFVHSAAAQQGVSLHLTLGVLATTVHDVLREVVELAADDLAFRRALPAGWPYDRDVAAEAVNAAVADLVDWLGHVDPGDVANRLCDGFVANRTPVLGGQLLELAGLDDVDDATVVRQRPGSIATLTVEETAPADNAGRRLLRLVLGDRQLVMPAALEPAVRRLIDGSPHPVAELSDLLDAPSRLVLVRRLIREGAVRTGASADDA
jgi:hypothetical protein